MYPVQLLSFRVSETLMQDQSAVLASAQGFRSADGCINVQHGFLIEDKNRMMLVIIWKTFEHWKTFSKTESYTALIESLPTNLARSIVDEMVMYPEDPSSAFDAPVTDVTTLVKKEGIAPEELDQALSSIRSLIDEIKVRNHPSSKYPTPYQVGVAQEVSDPYFILACGWELAETHKDYAKKAIVELPDKTQSVASCFSDVVVRHVALTK